MKKVIKWWFGPYFPVAHLDKILSYNPGGIIQKSRNFYRTWFLHPVKRRFAKYYLLFLRKIYGLKVIGITGSAGKTTTKEMLYSILKFQGETVCSYANIDPVYNIPTTVLRCKPSAKYLILEMGVEYKNEMDFYAWLARPDVGIITNIYPTHTEFFGDSGGVFREKSKLAKSIPKTGFVVLNGSDKFLRKLNGKLDARVVWFGNDMEVMSSLEKFTRDFKTEFSLIFDQDSKNKVKVKIPILGRQFVENALAAAACAYGLDISIDKIKKGLETFRSQEHRMRVIKHKSGAIIVDDSYNNNPVAAKEAINTLILFPKREKVIVFGDMLELGNWEKKYHLEVGKYISRFSIARLICVGKAVGETARVVAKIHGHSAVFVYPNWREALTDVKKYLNKNCVILVKGSRSIGLDNLVLELVKNQ